MKTIEIGTAVGLVGLTVFSVHSSYVQHAGTLNDARQAPPGDPATVQRIGDADFLAGTTALLVGGVVSYASGSIMPLALAIVGFALIAFYYHVTVSQPGITPTTREG